MKTNNKKGFAAHAVGPFYLCHYVPEFLAMFIRDFSYIHDLFSVHSSFILFVFLFSSNILLDRRFDTVHECLYSIPTS